MNRPSLLISALTALTVTGCATTWVHSQKPPTQFAAEQAECREQALADHPADIQTVARPVYGFDVFGPYGYANSAHFLFRSPFGHAGCVRVKDGTGRLICPRSAFIGPGFGYAGSTLGVVSYEQVDLNARKRQAAVKDCLRGKGWREAD